MEVNGDTLISVLHEEVGILALLCIQNQKTDWLF
jgi:hypothetical protein